MKKRIIKKKIKQAFGEVGCFRKTIKQEYRFLVGEDTEINKVSKEFLRVFGGGEKNND